MVVVRAGGGLGWERVGVRVALRAFGIFFPFGREGGGGLSVAAGSSGSGGGSPYPMTCGVGGYVGPTWRRGSARALRVDGFGSAGLGARLVGVGGRCGTGPPRVVGETDWWVLQGSRTYTCFLLLKVVGPHVSGTKEF